MKRAKYEESDAKDREAFLGSRTPVLQKSGEMDLWLAVIQRAIYDIALFTASKDVGLPLTEEELEFENSANSFLYDDDYRVPLDNYLINIKCHKCKHIWQSYISKISSKNAICPVCNHQRSWKYMEYDITPEQEVHDISLKELLSLLGIENIDGFRKGARTWIDELTDKKRVGLQAKADKINNKINKKETPVQDTNWNKNKEDEAVTIISDIENNVSPGNEDAHYCGKIEPIDFIEDQNLEHHEATAIKYLCRWQRKGGIEDLKKAIWYIARKIKIVEERNSK